MGHEKHLDAQAKEFEEAAGALNDRFDGDPGTEPITEAAYEDWMKRIGLAPGQKRYFPRYDDGPRGADPVGEPKKNNNVVPFPSKAPTPDTQEDGREAA